MSETTENKECIAERLAAFFESEISGHSDYSQENYRMAMRYLNGFLKLRGVSLADISQPLLAEWLVAMSMDGISIKTIGYYLKLSSYLYHAAMKAGIIPADNAFRTLINKLSHISSAAVSEQAFKRLISVLRAARSLTGTDALAADLLLFSLLNRGMDFAAIAALKKSDLPQLNAASAEIAGKYVSATRQYVFPLQQSKHTPRQLAARVGFMVSALMRARNIAGSDDITDLIKGYWCYCALKCGVAPSALIAILGYAPLSMPLLSLCVADGTEPVDADSVDAAVADMLVDNPRRWFAMQFRQSVKLEQIEKRFEVLPDSVARPDLFYPYEEICKRVGKKILHERRPVINNVAFFKTRITDVYPLFIRIGDLAWCFTSGRRHGSPYAVISEAAMTEFQTAIGEFTPDYEVGDIGSIDIREGDSVILLGSLFGRQQVTVKSCCTKVSKTGRTIFRISFSDMPDGRNGLEWCVDIEPGLVQKV